jgi:uncharacterized protein (UPF0128 family)
MELPPEEHNRFIGLCFDLSDNYNIKLMQIHSIITNLEHDKQILLIKFWEKDKIDLLMEHHKKVLLEEDLLTKDVINEILLLWKWYQ